MGPYEQGTASKEPHPDSPTSLEESMLHLGLGDSEGLPAYPERPDAAYPERPDAPDCAYYIRTGSCGYGVSCRFNHPRDREAIANAQRARFVEHPERVGEPVCQYFLRTGTCKYGNFCKYNHPRQRGGSVLPVTLNIHGYPLRPGEKECSYYMRTGRCKFGATCKFHHPQASGITIPLPTPAFYSTVQPLAVPSYPQYPITRPSVLPAPYMQEPYGPIFLSPGVIPVPSWSPYPLTVQTGSSDGSSTQLSSPGPAHPGAYLRAASSTGLSSNCQIEQTFPEKPDQPEATITLGQELIADTVPHVNTLIP